ncbi:MAG TPA: porin PorA family protein [Frankiaceae bacterium]|nr:porin PorA family protein [Frankiaceae bacterium]
MRRLGKVLVGVGVLLIVLGVVAVFALPALAVKYPGGPLNKTAHAQGTFTLYIDPASAAPLASPQKLPLDIKRNLHVIEIDGSRAVVQENDVEQIGTLKPQDLQQRYVLNRKSLKNVADDRAWAYTPSNKIDRSPAYSINLPFSSGNGPYQVWKNESGVSYAFTKTGSLKRAGVTLYRYQGSMKDAPAQSYYIDQLASQGIPKSLTPVQAAAQLKAQGADPALLESAVLPALAPLDRSTATAILAQNVPLKYTIDVQTSFLVEPKTGAIVGLEQINQTLNATPDIQGIGRIQTILNKPQYAKNAVIQSAATVIGKLVKSPPRSKIFNITYAQLPVSVDDLATFAKGRADKITLAKVTLPSAIGGAGIVLLLIGLGISWQARRRSTHGAGGPPGAPSRERQPA